MEFNGDDFLKASLSVNRYLYKEVKFCICTTTLLQELKIISEKTVIFQIFKNNLQTYCWISYTIENSNDATGSKGISSRFKKAKGSSHLIEKGPNNFLN